MTIGYSSYSSGLNTGIGGFSGAESQDVTVDGGFDLASGFAGWSINTTNPKTGAASWNVNANGSHEQNSPNLLLNLTAGVRSNRSVGCIMFWVRLSAAPATAGPLAGTASGTTSALEVGTDAKVRLVRLGGAGSIWSGRTALSDWSATAPPTDGVTWMHLAWFIDQTSRIEPSLPAQYAWHVLLLDEIEQWSVGVPAPFMTSAYPVPQIDAVNLGITIGLDDMCGMLGDYADIPMLVQWPKVQVNRQLAIGEAGGGFDGWTGTPDNTNQYTNWDDAAGNDGDTSYNAGASTSLGQASTGQSAATVGISGNTILPCYYNSAIGPAINIIRRNANAGKWAVTTYNSLGTGTTVPNPGASYDGLAGLFTKTGSPATWNSGHLASLNFGLLTGISGHNADARCTLCMMQWPSYASLLPLVQPYGVSLIPPRRPLKALLGR